jgi:hypothetical protein
MVRQSRSALRQCSPSEAYSNPGALQENEIGRGQVGDRLRIVAYDHELDLKVMV